jgi:hypothetical protein
MHVTPICIHLFPEEWMLIRPSELADAPCGEIVTKVILLYPIISVQFKNNTYRCTNVLDINGPRWFTEIFSRKFPSIPL